MDLICTACPRTKEFSSVGCNSNGVKARELKQQWCISCGIIHPTPTVPLCRGFWLPLVSLRAHCRSERWCPSSWGHANPALLRLFTPRLCERFWKRGSQIECSFSGNISKLSYKNNQYVAFFPSTKPQRIIPVLTCIREPCRGRANVPIPPTAVLICLHVKFCRAVIFFSYVYEMIFFAWKQVARQQIKSHPSVSYILLTEW